MRELAAKLGVSRTTVSLALRGDPRIPPETRERVAEVAKEMGYQSNALVNALMAQVRKGKKLEATREVVAYLTSYDTPDYWRGSPSMVEQYEAAKARGVELGFRLEAMWLGDRGAQSQRTARILATRGIRGSILAPVPVNIQTLDLAWHAHTVVAVGYSFSQAAVNRVVHHQINAALSCYENLKKLGYKRIALAIQEIDDVRVHRFWTCGYLGAQRIYGGDCLPPFYISNYDDPRPFLAWVEEHKPDCVISIWPHKVFDWLRAAGLSVPGQIGFASLDLGERRGELAGIFQDNETVGAASMDALCAQLLRNEIGIPRIPKVVMIEGMWMFGPTVARQVA